MPTVNKKFKDPVYPRGELTIHKIVQNYYDLMEYAGAKVIAKAFFCYPEYQEYWMRVRPANKDAHDVFINGRFGLNVPTDMMLGELQTSYTTPGTLISRLVNIGQSMIRTRGMNLAEALAASQADRPGNPDRIAAENWIKENSK